MGTLPIAQVDAARCQPAAAAAASARSINKVCAFALAQRKQLSIQVNQTERYRDVRRFFRAFCSSPANSHSEAVSGQTQYFNKRAGNKLDRNQTRHNSIRSETEKNTPAYQHRRLNNTLGQALSARLFVCPTGKSEVIRSQLIDEPARLSIIYRGRPACKMFLEWRQILSSRPGIKRRCYARQTDSGSLSLFLFPGASPDLLRCLCENLYEIRLMAEALIG